MDMKKLVLIISIFMLSFLYDSAIAATYYVDGKVLNDNGTGASLSPKKYIMSGISLLSSSGGDTLIIADGTYSSSYDVITKIPNGQPGAYNTIKAKYIGGVTISAINGFNIGSSYVQIIGLKISGPWNKLVSGNHIKLIKCAFEGGASSGNNINLAFGGSYNLLEDCWVYGLGGRYKVLIYRADHNILRRVVVRDDGGWTSTNGDPQAGITVYESPNILLQNCIVIDSDLTTYDNDNVGAFYLTGHAGNPSSNNIKWEGCIALNNKKSAWNIDTDDGGSGTKLVNCVAYNHEYVGCATGNTALNTVIENMTIGKCAITSGLAGYSKSGTLSATNTIVFDTTGDAVKNTTISYSNTFDTANNGSGIGVVHVNPLDAGLKHLIKIEDGSSLKTLGKNGSQIGADVRFKVGVSGTLFGENGFDRVTTDLLWRWPNEDLIKNDMAKVSNRGFCASGQTLTDYIWSSLGNKPDSSLFCSEINKVSNVRISN